MLPKHKTILDPKYIFSKHSINRNNFQSIFRETVNPPSALIQASSKIQLINQSTMENLMKITWFLVMLAVMVHANEGYPKECSSPDTAEVETIVESLVNSGPVSKTT